VISFRSNFYFRICEATLRSDMAKRIMYSVIPALAEPGQAYGTGGVIDYNALKYAIEGRHDIIKFGTRACIKEMRHYGAAARSAGQNVRNMEAEAKMYLAEGKPHEAINLAVQCFADHGHWEQSYGGKAWEAIARSLEKLITYDEELKKIRSDPNRNPEQEVEIMKMIVIELNVFDGLSHNTKSIMYNLVEQELTEERLKDPEKGPYIYDAITNEYNQIENLMDSKELKNPMDVYRQIKPALTESGDIHKFKDWVNKLKSSPDFFKQNKADLEDEFFRIRFRKNGYKYISRLNMAADQLQTEIPLDPNVTYLSIYPAINAVEELSVIGDNIVRQYKFSTGRVLEISKNLQSEFRKLREEIQKLKSAFEEYGYSTKYEKNNPNLYVGAKETIMRSLIALFKKAAYLADSV
jgi:hypothetical protein